MKDKLDKMKEDLKICEAQDDISGALEAIENAIINTEMQTLNLQKTIDKLTVAIKNIIAESGGHSLSNLDNDVLWQTREPINITRIAQEVMKVFKGEYYD